MQTNITDSNGTFLGGYYTAKPEALASADAISVIVYETTIRSGASQTNYTLADGVHAGQVKKIRLIVDGGGNAVVTPTNLAGADTTITFANAGEAVELIWDGANWNAMSLTCGSAQTAAAVA